MNGVLLIDKPKDYTSRDVVNEVGKILGTKKIGHTGTLDPIATGVLALCVGKYTKLADLLVCDKKEYIAEAILGIDTDTLDVTGKILKEENVHLKKEQIEQILSKFIGKYNQQVPIYSAVKINGKKLYEYARENKKVEIPSRLVEIQKLELIDDIKYENNKTIFKFKCLVSKGTYIRSLIRDIAASLNTYGVMKNLTRTIQGEFNLADCYSINDIKNGNFSFTNLEKCFTNFEKIIADAELIKKIQDGKVFDNIYNSSDIIFFDDNKNILAIYQDYEKCPGKIKPWKVF